MSSEESQRGGFRDESRIESGSGIHWCHVRIEGSLTRDALRYKELRSTNNFNDTSKKI